MQIILPRNPSTITLTTLGPHVITSPAGIIEAHRNGQINLEVAHYIQEQLRRFDTMERETNFERELVKTVVKEIIQELENK